jgi:KTSC domain
MNDMLIARTPVVSSCIASIGYAEETRILEVEFRSGAVYRYFLVPGGIHAALMAAASKGAYLNLCIKGRFPESRSSTPTAVGGCRS